MNPIKLLAALLCLQLSFSHALAATSAAPADDQPRVGAADLDAAFPRSNLQIATPDARLHRFDVWVADNDPRRMRGLMFVRELPAGTGMLFIYPTAQPIGMWMKNTFIALDMLFVDHQGKVIRVAHDTVPFSLETIHSGGAAQGVIELPAGTARALNINAGARVLHPAFTGSQDRRPGARQQ